MLSALELEQQFEMLSFLVDDFLMFIITVCTFTYF